MQKKTKKELCSELKQLVIDNDYAVTLPSMMTFSWIVQEHDTCSEVNIEMLLAIPQKDMCDLKLIGVHGREAWDICRYATENDLIKMIRTIKNEPEPTREVWAAVFARVGENGIPRCGVRLFSTQEGAKEYRDRMPFDDPNEAKSVFKLAYPEDLTEGQLVFEIYRSRGANSNMQSVGTSCDPVKAKKSYGYMRDELLEDYKTLTDDDEGCGRFITEYNEDGSTRIAGFNLSDNSNYVKHHYVIKTAVDFTMVE